MLGLGSFKVVEILVKHFTERLTQRRLGGLAHWKTSVSFEWAIIPRRGHPAPEGMRCEYDKSLEGFLEEFKQVLLHFFYVFLLKQLP